MNEEDNLSEEGLEDPYEKELREAKEAENKRIEDAKDDLTEGKIRRSRRGQGGDVGQLDIPGLFEARSGLRTTAALGTEIFLNTLVDPVLEPGTQVAAGTAINWLAQRIRGGELSKGELAAAGLASLIPGGAQGRAITQFAKGAGKGALSGAIETAGMAGIDEGRLPTAEELAAGIGIGAAFGGALSTPQATKALQDLRGRIKGQYTPIVVEAMSPKKRPPNFSTTGTFGRARYYQSPDHTKKVANELINTWGMRDLVFDFDQYEKMRPLVVPSKSRLFGELFESVPYTKVNFNTIQQAKVPKLQRQYSSIVTALGFPARKFQLHHTVPVKGSLPGYDGLAFGSDEWWEVTEILFRNMLRPGNDVFNLTALVGGNKPTTVLQKGIPTTFPTPHSVTHKFLDAKIGPSGELFWTKEVRDKMKLDFDYRRQKWQEYSELVKKSQDITNQAEFTFKDLYEDIPKDQLDDELDLLVERLVDLDDRGFLNSVKVEDNYQVPQMADIVKEVKEELLETEADANLRAIIGRDGLLAQFVRNRRIIESDLRMLSEMSLPEQLAAIQRSTGLSAEDIDLLLRTQPGFDIVKFIRDNQ